jgi:hypothetical protein
MSDTPTRSLLLAVELSKMGYRLLLEIGRASLDFARDEVLS